MPNKSSAPNKRPNYLLSIFSLAIVLFLLGFFGLLLLQSKQLSKQLKENVDIIVELKNDYNKDAYNKLEKSLGQANFSIEHSVEFVSKEAAMDIMAEELGEELLNLDLPNPLYDVFIFNVKEQYLSTDSLSNIRSVLLNHSIINDVYYQENLVEQLDKNINKISWILLVLSIFFSVLSISLIHNTVRLALYADRFTIKTQELVGASWEFISRPYLKRALLHGLISALLAIGALLIFQYWIQEQIPDIKDLQHPVAFVSLFVALLILGFLINWVSTFYIIRKYLSLREDELY